MSITKLMSHRNLILLLGMLLLVVSTRVQAGPWPVSQEATFLETVSSSEVLVEATGIWKSGESKKKKAQKDVTKNGVPRANADARKSAVNLVLFGGTDPLLKGDDRAKFEPHAGAFFVDNLNRYITWEEEQFVKKIKIDDGRGLKIVKRFKINRNLLQEDLVALGIIVARADLTDVLGYPFIMVLPTVETGENPLEVLKDNMQARHAASVVESFLTARQYDVVVPEQQAAMEALNQAQLTLGDRDEDFAYELALSVGSDVYITYSGSVETGGYGAQKYAMQVRAYETTTARLLGTETGYSRERKGEIMVSIEEAMNDAINNVLARINQYWQDDMSRGVQYKLVINIADDYDEDELEDIQFALEDCIEEVAASTKQNIMTNQTMDYILWCDPTEFEKSSDVYRAIKKSFSKSGADAELRRVNLNRKMILLKVDSM